MLLEEFLKPMGLTRHELANATHVSYRHISEMLKCRRRMTPSLALRLGKFFGMSAGFWMNLQLRCDLYEAQQVEEKELASIMTYNSGLPVSADSVLT